MRRYTLPAFAGFALLTVLSLAFAQPHAGSKDAAGATGAAAGAGQQAADEPLVSRMRVQDFPAAHYFYIPTETTIAQIGDYVAQAIPTMMTTVEEQHVKITNAMVFVYHGASQDPSRPFKLEIGFPVDPATKEVGDYKVRELDAFHCATVVYSGPIQGIGAAYQQLFGELIAAGMQPTGETREMYLYWEAPESPNNIVLVMAGVQ